MCSQVAKCVLSMNGVLDSIPSPKGGRRGEGGEEEKGEQLVLYLSSINIYRMTDYSRR